MNDIKVYRIYTFHRTQMIINGKNELIHRSTEDILSNHLPIYAQPFEDGIALFVIKDSKIIYLYNLLGKRTESNVPIAIPIVRNDDGTISFLVGEQFISARANGIFNQSNANNNWERFTLDRTEFDLTNEYLPPFVKHFEPNGNVQAINKTMPAISVIIPMFNAANFVEDTLSSLLTQTFQDFEVIVVDDCSTDNSVEVVEKNSARFGGKLKLIRLSKNNGEGGSPRNIGMNYAVGKYIFFLDSDDKLLNHAFELLYTVAEQTHADLIDNGKYYFFWSAQPSREPKLILNKNIKQLTFNQHDIDKRVRDFYYKQFWITPWCKFSRREFLIENRIAFPSTYAIEDASFTFQCIMCAKIFVRIPDTFYMYNLRPGSITKSRRSLEEHIGRFITTISAVFKLLDDFMNRINFFERHPKSRYMVIKHFFDYHINGGIAGLRAKYNNNVESQIYALTEKNIAQGVYFPDELIAIFLVSAHSRAQLLAEKDEQIAKLERELEKLQATKNPAE